VFRAGCLIGLTASLLVARPAVAELTKVSIASRTVVADGQAFGNTGAYEKLVGTVEFALDPSHPRNRAIVDLSFAPRGADGRVRVTSDLHVLRPVDGTKGNGVMLFEVANRGNTLLFGYFHGARGVRDPMTFADFGDAFLMREGYTIVWVGWQFDVGPDSIGLDAPPVDMRASPTPDQVRFSFILNERTAEAAPADLPRYLPVDSKDPVSTLTVRDRYWDAPMPLPRGAWRLVTTGAGRPRVALDSGFEPGRVYEITYRAQGAVVAGVGLAALRDAASAFQHRTDLPVSGRSAYIFGASQSGRLLRQFLLDGFNVDEQNRRVFALAWPHIAGAGLGPFNERLALPGYSSFPATRMPFTWPEILAPYTAAQMPRIVATNTAVEYWGQGRAAALTHTSIDGRSDLPIPDNVRIYFLAGTQHGEAPFPPPQGGGQQLSNPTPQVAAMRALLRGGDAWVKQGTPPPDSRYPQLADGTLVALPALSFPRIPGLGDPKTIEGPGQVRDGRFAALPFLVPRVDADGNDASGIRVPDLAVPLATVTGWNFRSERVGNPSTIFALLGSYVPLPATGAVRQARNDPRSSVEERYTGKDDYLSKIRTSAAALIKDRYLLQDDLDGVLARAGAHWDSVMRARPTTTAVR
jgi:hypothetical protein